MAPTPSQWHLLFSFRRVTSFVLLTIMPCDWQGHVDPRERSAALRSGEGVSEAMGNPRAAAAKALGTDLIIEKVR